MFSVLNRAARPRALPPLVAGYAAPSADPSCRRRVKKNAAGAPEPSGGQRCRCFTVLSLPGWAVRSRLFLLGGLVALAAEAILFALCRLLPGADPPAAADRFVCAGGHATPGGNHICPVSPVRPAGRGESGVV